MGAVLEVPAKPPGVARRMQNGDKGPMSFTVRFGEEVDASYLDNLVAIDQACYDEPYWGDPQKTVNRYLKNCQSFVFVEDQETGQVAGYINFFPCEEALYLDNLSRSNVIRDDDILPEEVAPWRHDANHLFIISLAVHPRYQGTDAIKLLSNGFVEYLNRLQEQGFPITDIMGTAVSPHGKKALANYLFREVRTLADGNTVYICDGKLLDHLLDGRLEVKSYKGDMYLLMPLADHRDNLRIAHFLEDYKAGTAKVPGTVEDRELAQALIADLKDCIAYECSNEVVNELELAYVGSFDFLQTTDEYAGVENPADEVIVGHARGHSVLVAHQKTHMYVLCTLLPSFPYSLTQMEDQVSFDYVKIVTPPDVRGQLSRLGWRAMVRPRRDDGQLVADDAPLKPGAPPEEQGFCPADTLPPDIFFTGYLLEKYGLHACGNATCALFLSRKPADRRELQDMLAGEAYHNYEREYCIQCESIDQASQQNRSQFSHYEVYLSQRAVVYVDGQFAPDIRQRVGGFADYLFIVILTLFQNTALSKAAKRVTGILEESTDITPETKLMIDREYGATVRFWEMQNFKFLSSQMEAAQLREAFMSRQLHDAYNEQQEYLEHVVASRAAITESRNGMVINIVAILLAVAQLQPLFIELLQGFYGEMGIETVYAQTTINYGILGGALLLLLVVLINQRRKRHLEARRY